MLYPHFYRCLTTAELQPLSGLKASSPQQTLGAFLSICPSSLLGLFLTFCSVSFPISSPSSLWPPLLTCIFDCPEVPRKGQRWGPGGSGEGCHVRVSAFPCRSCFSCNVCLSHLQGSLLSSPHFIVTKKILCYLCFKENLRNQVTCPLLHSQLTGFGLCLDSMSLKSILVLSCCHSPSPQPLLFNIFLR